MGRIFQDLYLDGINNPVNQCYVEDAAVDQEMLLERATKGWTVGEEDEVVPMESITPVTVSLLQEPPRAKTPLDERVDWGEDEL